MRPRFKTQRSSSMPTPKAQKSEDGGRLSPGLDDQDEDSLTPKDGTSRVSNEDNVLLDPEVLSDYPTQALVLTVLVSILFYLIYILNHFHSKQLKSNPISLTLLFYMKVMDI